MARYQHIVDLVWTDDGDFAVESDVSRDALGVNLGGDLRTTKKLKYRGWLQKVKTRLECSKMDWKLLGVGANLENFIGAQNTQATGEAIKMRVLNELTQDDLIRAQEMKIDVMPLSPDKIGLLIVVAAPGTGEQIIFTHSFSLRDTQTIQREG